MGAQEQEHESSLDKGDKTAARELKECLLEIQRQIDPSTRHVQDSSTDQYGKSWKDIKNANPAVFAERTEVENGGA
ncbi:BnaA02g07700D [Brassica napus]|uniref:BnaA02g07700D protein n=1 Tax=Brassica napus TaxID=3708 RepID=A0A078H775_BRANA|nr:BnaA02g07700D [Brassica napus]